MMRACRTHNRSFRAGQVLARRYIPALSCTVTANKELVGIAIIYNSQEVPLKSFALAIRSSMTG